ncbi:MAG: hypothetical protein MJ237_09365 [bacterium]|nr:hypothetical protein [bacterium]
MNAIKSMILAFIMSMSMNSKTDRAPRPYTFKTEYCIAVSSDTFKAPDGNYFKINNNNLQAGGGYWVLFDTFNTSSRFDDDIVDFDTDLYYKWVKFI